MRIYFGFTHNKRVIDIVKRTHKLWNNPYLSLSQFVSCFFSNYPKFLNYCAFFFSFFFLIFFNSQSNVKIDNLKHYLKPTASIPLIDTSVCELSELQKIDHLPLNVSPFSNVFSRGESRILWKVGFARPVGVPGLWEDGLVNQAFGYSSFLKDGGSFITYTVQGAQLKKNDASQVYHVNMEIMGRIPHVVLWLKEELNPELPLDLSLFSCCLCWF